MIHIIGDRREENIFDDDLARRVNEEAEQTARREELKNSLAAKRKPKAAAEPTPKNPDTPPAALADIIIGAVDSAAADNGSKRTQDEWVSSYWPTVQDREMAAMPDFYAHFKLLQQEYLRGNAAQKAAVQKIVDSYRDDFDWPKQQNWLLAGTRHVHSSNSERTEIIHHYDCSRTELVKRITIDVPVYLGRVIADVTGQAKGLKYLQAELGTVDDGNTIMSTLEFISGMNKSKIKVWTPPIAEVGGYVTRQAFPERAAGFLYINGVFHIYGYLNLLNIQGRSRGVKVKSA